MDHKIKNTKFHESLIITGDLVGDNLDLLLSGHVLVTHFGIALHTVNPGIQLESEEIRTWVVLISNFTGQFLNSVEWSAKERAISKLLAEGQLSNESKFEYPRSVPYYSRLMDAGQNPEVFRYEVRYEVHEDSTFLRISGGNLREIAQKEPKFYRCLQSLIARYQRKELLQLFEGQNAITFQRCDDQTPTYKRPFQQIRDGNEKTQGRDKPIWIF